MQKLNKVTKTKLFDLLVQRAERGMFVTTKDIKECIAILRGQPVQKLQFYSLALYRYVPNDWLAGKNWNQGGWRRPTVNDLRYLTKAGPAKWWIREGKCVLTKVT